MNDDEKEKGTEKHLAKCRPQMSSENTPWNAPTEFISSQSIITSAEKYTWRLPDKTVDIARICIHTTIWEWVHPTRGFVTWCQLCGSFGEQDGIFKEGKR